MSKALEGYEAIRVLGARVVVKIEENDNKTKGGIILMADTQEPKFEGLVVSTGDGVRLDTGVRMPMDVKPGDNVIYSRMAGVPITHNDENFIVINERDIIAVME